MKGIVLPGARKVKFMKKFNFSKGLVIGLLTLALCLTCFGYVKASAAAPSAVSATYDPATNKITVPACQLFILKAEKDNVLKKGATGKELEAGSYTLAELGIKSTTKDAYLYFCSVTDITDDDGVTVNPNLIIKPQAAKKIVAKINYVKADDKTATDVLSADVTDASGNAIANPVIYWWDGDEEHNWALANTFTGEDLAELLENGGTIYIRQNGTATQFSSKPVKVKIAKQAKAPKIKLDAKKDSIALKNGFDFGVATTNDGGETYTVAANAWQTILPFFKEATAKTADVSIIATSTYVPVDKKDAGYKGVTTQYKFKAITVADIFSKLSQTQKFTLAVRKSATDKKPASAFSVIELDVPAEAPLVFTKNLVDGDYLVGSVAKTDFEKKGIVIGDIKNYPGTKSSKPNTTGFWNTFEVVTDGSDADTVDEAKAAYEFCVVKEVDYSNNKIDWTSVTWKKIAPGKTKITSKLKTVYLTTGSTQKTTAEFKAIAAPAGFDAANYDATAHADTYPSGANLLLVRRVGTKDGVRASKATVLYALSEGKDVNLYSTVCLGEAADKYTIQFASYKFDKNDAAKTGWFLDESIEPVVGYFKVDTDVEIPDLEGADYFEITAPAMADKTVKATTFANAKTSLTNGKVAVTNTGTDVTITYAIKKYANVKVKAVGYESSTKAKDSEKIIAVVENGVVLTYANNTFSAPNSPTVTAYVGDEIAALELEEYEAPTGYVLNGDPTKLEEGKGYTPAASGDYTAKTNSVKAKAKFTVNSAEAVEVTIKYPVVKTFTVTFDLNYTGATGTPSPATTDKDKKITLPSNPTRAEDAENTYTFAGWFDNAAGTGTAKDANSTYTANTKLYAKWTATPKQNGNGG